MSAWRIVPIVISMSLAATAVAAVAAPVTAGDVIRVNSVSDAADASGGSGACDANAGRSGSQCTLRAAIQTANADPDRDLIVFTFGGTKVRTIRVSSALPLITEPIGINGYSALNTRRNSRRLGSNARLRIVLKGPGSSATYAGLQVAALSTVQGLVIQSFLDGIVVHPGGEGSRVMGNYIGTSPSGMRRAGNIKSGVYVDCDSAVIIGGGNKGARNVISGNRGHGILLCERVAGTVIKGNLIGVGADNKKALGNRGHGIAAYGTENVVIGGDNKLAQNSIAHNWRNGVQLTPSPEGDAFGVQILGNSFFRNIGLAIDLDGDGLTPNDGALDLDGGANHRQNFPVIRKAIHKATKTVVRGQMLGEASSAYRIRLFVDTYKEREGKRLLKSFTVRTNANGKTWWSTSTAKLRVGKSITATATNLTRNPDETSEFSVSRKVTK